jgi:hypothetical protein
MSRPGRPATPGVAPEAQLKRPQSFVEWRQLKREQSTAALQLERHTSAAALLPENSAHRHHVESMRRCRSGYVVERQQRRQHSFAHVKKVRELEGRAAAGANSVPLWYAMQHSILEQQRQRDDAFKGHRTAARNQRIESRSVFLQSAPRGSSARVRRVLERPATSVIARVLLQERELVGTPPNVDDDATWSLGSSSAEDVPDPGWKDPPRPATSESVKRRMRSMSPEQRARAEAAALLAAKEYGGSADDP